MKRKWLIVIGRFAKNIGCGAIVTGYFDREAHLNERLDEWCEITISSNENCPVHILPSSMIHHIDGDQNIDFLLTFFSIATGDGAITDMRIHDCVYLAKGKLLFAHSVLELRSRLITARAIVDTVVVENFTRAKHRLDC